jgi:hypothetical protein
MATLTKASRELFTRPPDERFESLGDLHRHCHALRQRSISSREPSSTFRFTTEADHVAVQLNGHPVSRMNDWAFTQVCGLAGASKSTLNRLRPQTAADALNELFGQRASDRTAVQALTTDRTLIRAFNGDKYVRLWNADVVDLLQEVATDFTPPQKGIGGGTGLYAGEQDMFCFLIDPTCWVEIKGEAFAPGFFVWNSEVGKRTIGISTFWFQRVCSNHLVWDAIEVVEFTRRHLGGVGDALTVIRSLIAHLVRTRDERKDAFAKVIGKAMETRCGQDAAEVTKLLLDRGFTKMIATLAVQHAREKGRFTIWSIVDGLTQASRTFRYAGERTQLDQKAAGLLSLAA